MARIQRVGVQNVPMRKPFVFSVVAAAVLLAGLAAIAGPEQSTTTKTRTETYSSKNGRVFTLEKAVLTAIQRNPDVLRALQEIERAKGVIIQVRAEALPQIR